MRKLLLLALLLGIFTCLAADEFSDTVNSICKTGRFQEGADGLKYFILNGSFGEEEVQALAQKIAHVCLMFAPVRLNWWPVAETKTMANVRGVDYIGGNVSNAEGDFVMAYPMSSMDVYSQDELCKDYDSAMRIMVGRVYTECFWWSYEDLFGGDEDR